MIEIGKFLNYSLIGAGILIALLLIGYLGLFAILGNVDKETTEDYMNAGKTFLDKNKTEGFSAAWDSLPPKLQEWITLVGIIAVGSFVGQHLLPLLVGFAVWKYKKGSPLEGGLGGVLAFVLYEIGSRVVPLVVGVLGFNTLGNASIKRTEISVCLIAGLIIAFVLGALGVFLARILDGIKININLNVDAKIKLANLIDPSLKGAAVLFVLCLLYGIFILSLIGQDAPLIRDAPRDSTGFKVLPPGLAEKYSVIVSVSFALLALNFIVSAFVGFLIVKHNKGRILEAGLGGTLAVLFSLIAQVVLSLILKVVGFEVDISITERSVSNDILVILCTPFIIAAAFISGTLGGFIARKFFPDKPAPKKKK